MLPAVRLTRHYNPHVPAFLGLDLAWTPGRPSGVCILEGGTTGLTVTRLDCLTAAPEAFAGLATSLGPDVVAAIDAPLIVGPLRRAEAELARVFGPYRASAYNANLTFLTRMNGLAGPHLAAHLAREGFTLDPAALTLGASSRFALEVFPHAAHVAFFPIPERLQYKKGVLARRRTGLAAYQQHLSAWLVASSLASLARQPLIAGVLTEDPAHLPGIALKHLEDRLDALTCALVAWQCWDTGRFLTFGDPTQGCIVAPAAPLLPRPTSVRAPTSPSVPAPVRAQSSPPGPAAGAPS